MADADTRDKRASVLSLSLPIWTVYPDPDGAVSTADRVQTAYLYAGIAPSSATDPELTFTANVYLAQASTMSEAFLAQANTTNAHLAQANTEDEVFMA